MRVTPIRAAAWATSLCTLVVVLTSTAAGAVVTRGAAPPPPPPKCRDITLICDDGQQTGGSSGSGGSPGGTRPQPCVTAQGRTVPCTTENGVWSNARGCYLKPAPNPPKMPPAGSTSGGWYICHLLDSPVDTNEFPIWIEGPAPIDPGVIARQILAEIRLARVGIGITPRPGKTGLIGLPTYLWVTNPGPRTLGPISDSASAGGITVTLTARVRNVVWDLGDGTSVTCTGAGTPYRDEFGALPSPTCGHVYERPSTAQPSGVYRVTATAVWDVTWTGGGQTGVIPFNVTSQTAVRMGEVQVLN